MGWLYSTTLFAALLPLTVIVVDKVRKILQRRFEKERCPHPPGPVPFPLLGSTLSTDAKRPWLTYTEWQKTYGDIIYVRLLDTEIVVLNSTSVATELLDKRSRIYSDRPFLPTIVPYGIDCNFALLEYGETWRLNRRIFQQTFNASASLNFRPIQLRTAKQLIRSIIDNSDDYPHHFQMFSSAIVMSTVYDYEPSPQNDPMISIVNNYLHWAIPGLAPGKVLLVKLFPFLLHVPDWLPGSWISREAKEACAWRDKLVEIPYQYVKRRMESNDHVNAGMVPDNIIRMAKFTGSYHSEYETALKGASVSALTGSIETTSATLMTFTLAMVENPHVWKRAQVEIETVIGTDRLPEFHDMQSLPYIEAIIRETMRWRPAVPIAWRAVMDSDTYEGYYIPKGATVLLNAWAITRNEIRYPDAEKFMPERFLDAEGRLVKDDPREFLFGFGRRKCPGRYTADGSLWSAIATMLATLDFNPAKDLNGNDVVFKATFSAGMIEYPDPFPCRLTPRVHFDEEFLDRLLVK